MTLSRINAFGITLSDDIIDNAHRTLREVYNDKSRRGSDMFNPSSEFGVPAPEVFREYFASGEAAAVHGQDTVDKFHAIPDDEKWYFTMKPIGAQKEYIPDEIRQIIDVADAVRFVTNTAGTSQPHSFRTSQVAYRASETENFRQVVLTCTTENGFEGRNVEPLTMFDLGLWLGLTDNIPYNEPDYLDTVRIGELANIYGSSEGGYCALYSNNIGITEFLKANRSLFLEYDALLWLYLSTWKIEGMSEFSYEEISIMKSYAHTASKNITPQMAFDFHRSGITDISDIVAFSVSGHSPSQVKPYILAGVNSPDFIGYCIDSGVDPELAESIQKTNLL